MLEPGSPGVFPTVDVKAPSDDARSRVAAIPVLADTMKSPPAAMFALCQRDLLALFGTRAVSARDELPSRLRDLLHDLTGITGSGDHRRELLGPHDDELVVHESRPARNWTSGTR